MVSMFDETVTAWCEGGASSELRVSLSVNDADGAVWALISACHDGDEGDKIVEVELPAGELRRFANELIAASYRTEADRVRLVSDCGHTFFGTMSGDYTCPECGRHDGDRHLLSMEPFGESA